MWVRTVSGAMVRRAAICSPDAPVARSRNISNSRWVSEKSTAPSWLELDLSSVQKLAGTHLYSGYGNADPVQDFVLCNDSCNRCIKACPVEAINNGNVCQLKCRQNSNYTNKKGYSLYTCNNCRKVCPYRAGVDDNISKPIELSKLIVAKNLMC